MVENMKRKKVLIVDDDETIGRVLGNILERMSWEFSLVPDAEQARQMLEEETFDLLLCDIHLPGESGMDLIKFVITTYPDMAIIMISGEDNPEMFELALEIGAYGYIVKPFKVSEVIINVSSAFRRQRLEVERRIYRENLEQTVANRTAKLLETLDGIIHAMAHVVETRDPYTAGHQQRVASLACRIAEKMGFSSDQLKGICMAGVVHDIGKIAVPAEILSKPSQLNALEFGLIKAHSQTGYDILKGIEFPWRIADMVYQHHERANGSGYPLGLKENEILLESRILAVADVVEAMASHRPYRPALGIDAALDEISKNRGVFYDPQVADGCLSVFKDDGFTFAELRRL
jgi:putative nucleotidyltransferase with HDIG domain